MEIINQRKNYLQKLKIDTRKFWLVVVKDYNSGLSATKIANKYTNHRTGKKYSRQHIHSILKIMRNVN